MGVRIAPIPEGSRVRIRRAHVPQDPALMGRLGTVVTSTEYDAHKVGVALDGEAEMRPFHPAELEPVELPALAPDREAAKRLRALP